MFGVVQSRIPEWHRLGSDIWDTLPTGPAVGAALYLFPPQKTCWRTKQRWECSV